MALQAGHKIAELEVFLRNKLDFCLKDLVGEEWIRTPKSLEFVKEKKEPIETLTHSQILSKLMLGEVIALINTYKIEHYMIDLRDMDLKKYHWSNSGFFKTVYPKNQSKKNRTIIGVMPEMILEFLDDLLRSIKNPTIEKFQDIEMKYKGK